MDGGLCSCQRLDSSGVSRLLFQPLMQEFHAGCAAISIAFMLQLFMGGSRDFLNYGLCLHLGERQCAVHMTAMLSDNGLSPHARQTVPLQPILPASVAE